MFKKLVSLILLLSFLSFSISCYTSATIPKDEFVESGDKNVKILAVQKKSGEHIAFFKDYLGILKDDVITGKVKQKVDVKIEIDRKNVRTIYFNTVEGNTHIITKEGRTYSVAEYKKDKDNIYIDSLYELTSVSIPISDIDLVYIKKVDPVKDVGIILAGTIVVGIVVGIIILIASGAPSETSDRPGGSSSCPFIYSFNGEQYIFDAEPYGAALCEGLQRTEWCGLEHLKESEGQYKILVTNELNETQYIDELNLVMVDHPKDVQVAPDNLGNIHTFTDLLVPTRAYDKQGRDLLPFLSENDRVYWHSRVEEKDPENVEDLKEELILEFPRPEGAGQAKLLINGCTTMWGSQAIRHYLELYGDQVGEWYDEINRFGPAHSRLLNMHMTEELNALQIRVKTEEGWKTRGLIRGTGPLVSEDRVYPIDISDVPGEMLQIKLTPAVNFWMFNYMGVDYTEDIPVQVKETEAIQATDHEGRDVRARMSSSDHTYHIMPNIGDRVEMVYDAPALEGDLARTVMLKANGYYDIHLESEGEPEIALLERFQTEPGFVIQYALKQYLKWEKQVMEAFSKR